MVCRIGGAGVVTRLLVIGLLFPLLVKADSITLRDGSLIEGSILSKTATQFYITVSSGEAQYVSVEDVAQYEWRGRTVVLVSPETRPSQRLETAPDTQPVTSRPFAAIPASRPASRPMQQHVSESHPRPTSTRAVSPPSTSVSTRPATPPPSFNSMAQHPQSQEATDLSHAGEDNKSSASGPAAPQAKDSSTGGVVCCASIGLIAVLLLVLQIVFGKPSQCQVCGNPIRRNAYKWKLQGKTTWVCGNCNRSLERKASQAAIKGLGL